ncbi:MAG: hypothetical protein U0165_00855 [Polyangiaceae bacterium]
MRTLSARHHIRARRFTRDADATFSDDLSGLHAVMSGSASTWTAKNECTLALEVLESHRGPSSEWTLDALSKLVREIDQHIYEPVKTDDPFDLWGWGMSLVVAAFVGPRVRIAHVGRCRAYRVDKGAATPLTVDHSLLALLSMSSSFQQTDEATRREALRSHGRIQLQCLGSQALSAITFNEVDLSPSSTLVLVSPGATLALETTDELKRWEGSPLDAFATWVTQRGKQLEDANATAESQGDIDAASVVIEPFGPSER